jgi:hypothetical protein
MATRFFDGEWPPGGRVRRLLIGIAFDETPGPDRGQMRESVRPATAEDAGLYGEAYRAYTEAGGELEPLVPWEGPAAASTGRPPIPPPYPPGQPYAPPDMAPATVLAPPPPLEPPPVPQPLAQPPGYPPPGYPPPGYPPPGGA